MFSIYAIAALSLYSTQSGGLHAPMRRWRDQGWDPVLAELSSNGGGVIKDLQERQNATTFGEVVSRSDFQGGTSFLVGHTRKAHPPADPDPSGECEVTDGVITQRGARVEVYGDQTDCGEDVKDLGFVNTSQALDECAAKVENSEECGLKFHMDSAADPNTTCKCQQKGHKCALRDNSGTCTYQLLPPVCGNTTGATVINGSAQIAFGAVAPEAFKSDCAYQISLGIQFDGLTACAQAAIDHAECGSIFQMGNTNFQCTCLKNGTTCVGADSEDFCMYEIYETLGDTSEEK